MIDNINTKPELGINFSNLPPGSYIIKDGKLLPNLDDSAMKERNEKRETKDDAVISIPILSGEKSLPEKELKEKIKDKEV